MSREKCDAKSFVRGVLLVWIKNFSFFLMGYLTKAKLTSVQLFIESCVGETRKGELKPFLKVNRKQPPPGFEQRICFNDNRYAKPASFYAIISSCCRYLLLVYLRVFMPLCVHVCLPSCECVCVWVCNWLSTKPEYGTRPVLWWELCTKGDLCTASSKIFGAVDISLMRRFKHRAIT